MKRSLRRAVSLLCVLAMCIGLLPSTALAWNGSDRSGSTIVRFYISGTGSTQAYNAENQPMGDGRYDPLYVEKGFALLEDSTITNSTAASEGEKIEGDTEVRKWLEDYASIPKALSDLDAVVEAINAVYEKNNILTELQTDYFNNFVFESVEWIGSNDSSYHVHVQLNRIECKVTFDQNYEGAPTPEEKNVGKGTAVSEPSTPTREGYTFEGWYTDQRFTNKYDFVTLVTEDITLYAKWEKTGPDITVTKELTGVLRDGEEQEGPFSDETVLYENDQLTWTITVTNNTESALSFKIEDCLQLEKVITAVESDVVEKKLEVTDDSANFSPDWVTVQSKQSAKMTASYTVDEDFDVDGYTLTNTATVTRNGETYTDDTTNQVGYTIKVTYDGNDGTADGQDIKTVTLREPSLPIDYPVERTAFGFEKAGYTFDGWYTEKTDGEEVTGEQQDLYSGATYFAHWTKNEKTYGAGYFVLVPSAIPDDFDPTEGYSVDTYLPNTGG